MLTWCVHNIEQHCINFQYIALDQNVGTHYLMFWKQLLISSYLRVNLKIISINCKINQLTYIKIKGRFIWWVVGCDIMSQLSCVFYSCVYCVLCVFLLCQVFIWNLFCSTQILICNHLPSWKDLCHVNQCHVSLGALAQQTNASIMSVCKCLMYVLVMWQ